MVRLIAAVLFSVTLYAPSALSMTKFGPTKKGDTLWNIAMANRPSKAITAEQFIASLRVINPHAIKGTNTLRTGVFLTMPTTPEEVKQALNQPEARALTPKNQYENTIQTLKKSVQSEHVARMEVERQLLAMSETMAMEERKIHDLEAALYKSRSSFPWSWFWFMSLMAFATYFMFFKDQKNKTSFSQKLAAARLGFRPSDVRGMSFRAYPTKKFENGYRFSTEDTVVGGHGAAVAESMIDVAEGNASAAVNRLKARIQRDPENLELRMHLLETYRDMNDRDHFKQESDYVLANMLRESDPEWEKIQSMYLSKWVYD